MKYAHAAISHALRRGMRWSPLAPLLATIVLGAPPATAQLGQDTRRATRNDVSPALRIDRGTRTPRRSTRRSNSYRTIDGSDNNRTDPLLGATNTQLVRIATPAYADGISALAGAQRRSAREISNLVNAQPELLENALDASDFLWQWGQFLDHDIDLTDGTDPPEPANIAVPLGDPQFDPAGTGSVEIALNRSIYDALTGTPDGGPRQQINEITAWIDASNVYGSDEERASALRTNDGTGRLRTSDGNLLPFNTDGLPNAGGTSPTLFLAGDVRANEQVGLTALHTLFVREHNRLAALLATEHPDWDGDRLYEEARRLVGAEMQAITYREFLPALLGPDALPPYRGYDADANAGIANAFSTAAYRFGHSALSPTLLRIDADGIEIPEGHLALRDAFFAPSRIIDEGGIDPLLRGLAKQYCQAIDVYVVDDVRNFLFGPPGAGGFDLASLNIQRGRDHGLPGYNDLRAALGLARATSFADISSDAVIQARLANAYVSVDDVDAWVGGLAEDRVGRGHVGALVRRILIDQFRALRDGDRYWYQRMLSAREIAFVESLKLSDIIRLNTGIGDELSDNVFEGGQATCRRCGNRTTRTRSVRTSFRAR